MENVLQFLYSVYFINIHSQHFSQLWLEWKWDKPGSGMHSRNTVKHREKESLTIFYIHFSKPFVEYWASKVIFIFTNSEYGLLHLLLVKYP